MSTLHVDCANGVGAPKLREMMKHISSDVLSVDVVNDNITALGQLNKNVSVLNLTGLFLIVGGKFIYLYLFIYSAVLISSKPNNVLLLVFLSLLVIDAVHLMVMLIVLYSTTSLLMVHSDS